MRARRLCSWLLIGVAAGWSAARADVVPAEDAATYAGSSVTVEGDVASVTRDADAIVLELAPGGPKSLRVVLVISLISSLPREPERVYQGKRVRVTGLIQRFQGRPEMVCESASQIAIVDLAGTTVTTTLPPPTPAPPATSALPSASTSRIGAPPAAPPTTPPPSPPVVASPPAATTAVAAPPVVTEPARTPAPAAAAPPTAAPAAPVEEAPAPRPLLAERLAAQACESARSRWRDAAAKARTASDALVRCLDAGTFKCRAEAAALAPALGDLEWAEQRVADRCD